MSEKVRRPGEKIRRKQIIEAATEEFGIKNYHWATTKEIAERAGVSERTVFFYYYNKKELYRAVFNQALEEFMQGLLRANPPTNDYRTFFKMASRNLISFIQENPVKMKLLMQGVDVADDDELRVDYLKVLDSIYTFVRSYLESAREREEIQEGVSVDALAVLMAGLYIVACYAEILDLDWFKEDREDIETVIDSFVDMMTLGAVPGPAVAPKKAVTDIKSKGGLN